jgi:hypothetical protein
MPYILIMFIIKKMIVASALLVLIGCTPESIEPIPPGIHITVEQGAIGFDYQTIQEVYAEVAACSVGYVPAPNFKIIFQATPPTQNGIVKNGLTTYGTVSGNITVQIFQTPDHNYSGSDWILRHELVHVALFYYGVTDQDTHSYHRSIRFNECS